MCCELLGNMLRYMLNIIIPVFKLTKSMLFEDFEDYYNIALLHGRAFWTETIT